MTTPIVMESDIAEAEKKIGLLKERREKRLHLDVGDGLFSEMISVTPADLVGKLDGMEIDVHLLVDDPTEWIEECALLRPKRVIGQIERMGSQELFLHDVKERGMVGGLALKLETPVESLSREALLKCEVILLLSVPAGTSGSKFDEAVIEKIIDLRKFWEKSILVDGGIDRKMEKRVMEVGVHETAANSAYWRGEWK